MDYETKILLNNLIDAVNTTNTHDWVDYVNVFGILGISLYLGIRQICVQKRANKIQLYEKLLSIYEAVKHDISEVHGIDFLLYGILISGKDSHAITRKIPQITYSAEHMLNKEDYEKLKQIDGCVQGILIGLFELKLFIDTLPNETKKEYADTLLFNRMNIDFIVKDFQKSNSIAQRRGEMFLQKREELNQILNSGFIEHLSKISNINIISGKI